MVPNGIDPSNSCRLPDLAALRASFAGRRSGSVLLVGRLVYEKGFQVALEALPG